MVGRSRKDIAVAGAAVAVASVLTLATMGRATIVLVIALLASYGFWITRSEWPPPSRVLIMYTAAVVVQCAHLIEEYQAGFYRVFPGVFGAEPWSKRRFLAFNFVWLILFVIAGAGLARGKRGAYLVATFLALGGGIANGLGHIALSAREGGYFPGGYTGAIALVVGSFLMYSLTRKPN
jgi:uncharacterized protein with HXXEE motif